MFAGIYFLQFKDSDTFRQINLSQILMYLQYTLDTCTFVPKYVYVQALLGKTVKPVLRDHLSSACLHRPSVPGR